MKKLKYSLSIEGKTVITLNDEDISEAEVMGLKYLEKIKNKEIDDEDPEHYFLNCINNIVVDYCGDYVQLSINPIADSGYYTSIGVTLSPEDLIKLSDILNFLRTNHIKKN